MDLKQKIINRANQLQQEAAIGVDSDDKRKNRIRAAEQWVEHFLAVTEFMESLDDDEPIESKDDLVKLLVESWESKEHDKDISLRSKFAKLRTAA